MQEYDLLFKGPPSFGQNLKQQQFFLVGLSLKFFFSNLYHKAEGEGCKGYRQYSKAEKTEFVKQGTKIRYKVIFTLCVPHTSYKFEKFTALS